MREISIFADESGDQGGHSRCYALTLVFHDQDDDVETEFAKYRSGLLARQLRDIPFHAGPLMNGHDDYESMELATRKSYFAQFFIMVQHLPVKYRTFVYKRSEMQEPDALTHRMRQDITNLLFDELSFFQSFDKVKIYYDGGQDVVATALREAVEYVLSKGSVLYRKTKSSDFMLAQVADMLCTLEVTDRKYRANELTKTDEKMFGRSKAFRNNYMKAIKRKRLA
ncbi:MAG: DUF3800 domain-containing protein [Eggerthellaceae bacterium]|nr:DUF3800 domain-containing protein [Eggerthellaceae bacterium]